MVAAAGSMLLLAPVIGQSPLRRIDLRARRLEFNPSVIELELGETVVLVAVTEDVIHGISVPDLSVRADLIPGRGPIEIKLHGRKPGRFTMVCDNFCGDGHDKMFGTVVVKSGATRQ